MKVRGLTIVDSAGNTVWDLQGDDVGAKSANGYIIHDVFEFSWPLLVGSLSSFIWTCTTGAWRLAYCSTAITVSGGASAAVKLVHCALSVALASGTDQLTGTIDVQETGPDLTYGTLIAAPTLFTPGDSLGLVFSGTLTGLVGVMTVGMKRVG